MAATAGRTLRVKVATTSGGSYNVVVGINSASMSKQGQTVDITTLTDADIVKLLGVRDTRYTIEANWETDATGQGVIRTALENDSACFVQFLPNGTAGYQQEVKVAKYEIGGAAGPNKISASIEFEGSGAITAI
jgi:predicted secreted protein